MCNQCYLLLNDNIIITIGPTIVTKNTPLTNEDTIKGYKPQERLDIAVFYSVDLSFYNKLEIRLDQRQ